MVKFSMLLGSFAVAQGGYVLQTSGKCAMPITSSADCAKAAAAIRLSDRSVSDDRQNGVSYDPKGCYYESNSLKYNSRNTNRGSCTTVDKCLCKTATPVAWPKMSLQHCAQNKAVSTGYSSKASAQAACAKNSKCSGIYDPSCDARGTWYQCNYSKYLRSSSSCVYKKTPTAVMPTPAPARKYSLQTQGTCRYPITSSATCAAAAKELNLSDKTVSDDGQHGGVSYDPKGCYLEFGNLKYNSQHKNTGACTTSDQCLCAISAPKKVNCVASYGPWSQCRTPSNRCGINGTQRRTRTITTPAWNGGSNCFHTVQPCRGKKCMSVNCVGMWGSWWPCNKKCGGGEQGRAFVISVPERYGGTCPQLKNTNLHKRPCNMQMCPVNCVGSYGPWRVCDKACGGGTQKMVFHASTPPSFGGTACPTDKDRPCNTHACCPVVRCPAPERGCTYLPSAELNANGCIKHPCGVKKCEKVCSHTMCFFTELPHKIGEPTVAIMQVVHNNKENMCSRHETVGKGKYIAHNSQAHCAKVNDKTNPNYGKCKCHKLGFHPNGAPVNNAAGSVAGSAVAAAGNVDLAKQRAASAGFELGGAGYKFELTAFTPKPDNWGTKGLYYYTSGKYKGMAFFGTGGTAAQEVAPVSPPKARIAITEADYNTMLSSHQQMPYNVGAITRDGTDYAAHDGHVRPTKPCAMVQCQAGWTLAGADERGCGGTCEKPRSNTFVALGGGKNTRGRCTTCENVFTKPVTTNAIRVQNDGETRSFQIAELDCKDVNGNVVKATGARSDYWHWRRRKSGWAPLVIDGITKYSNTQHTEFKKDLTVWFPTEVTLASCTLYQRGQNVAHNREKWHWEAFDGAYDSMQLCKKAHPTVDFAHASDPDPSKAGCAYSCDKGWEGVSCDIDSSKVVLPKNSFYPLANGFNNLGRCTDCPSRFAPVTTNAIRVQNDKETRSFQIAELECKDANGDVVKASGARSDYWHWRRRKTGWAPLVIDGDVKYSNTQHTEFKQDLTVWFPTEVTLASCTLHQRGQNVAHNRESWHWEAFNGAYTDETCTKTHPTVNWAHATVPDLAVAGCAYSCDKGWEGGNCDIDSSKVVRAPNAFYAIPNGFNNQGRCTTCPSRFAPVTTNAIRIKNDKVFKSRGSTFTVSEIDCKDANGNTIQAAGARTDERPDWRNRKTTVAAKLINGNTKYSGANYAQAYDWINVFFSSQVTVASCTLHQRGQNVAHNQDDWHWEAFNGNFVDSA